MAASQKLYPRATIKKIVKAHSKKNVSKNVDVLVSFQRLVRVKQLLIRRIDFSGLYPLHTDVRISSLNVHLQKTVANELLLGY
jgi:hypothetical protein